MTEKLTTRMDQILNNPNPPFKTPGTLGEEDRAIIFESIILPMMLTLLEKDRQTLETLESLKMREIFVKNIARVMDMITQDLTAIRKRMRADGIKLYLESKDDQGVRYMFVCKGYTERMFLLWNTSIKPNILERMAAYFEVSLEEEA